MIKTQIESDGNFRLAFFNNSCFVLMFYVCSAGFFFNYVILSGFEFIFVVFFIVFFFVVVFFFCLFLFFGGFFVLFVFLGGRDARCSNKFDEGVFLVLKNFVSLLIASLNLICDFTVEGHVVFGWAIL